MTKNTAGRLGTKPHKPIGLRDATIAVRASVLVDLIKSFEPLNTAERTNILAAAAEFYGLSLTVQN
jgi:hypothetical protein